MKKILYIILGAAFLQACNLEDPSVSLYPNDNPNFSRITITSPTTSLSVDYGDEFIFTPTVKQTIDGEALEYIWTANGYNMTTKLYDKQFSCGKGSTLKYRFEESGTFKLRLEVKNRFYSEFKTWDISVRIYDKGFFVVGTDASGAANIAFARTLSATDSLEGKEFGFTTDLIAKVNPDYKIKDVVYIGKSMVVQGQALAYLNIFTKDKIYTADASTLKIFDTQDFGALYPDEYITKVSMWDETNSLTSTLFTSKGRFIAFKRKEMGLIQTDAYVGLYYDNAYVNMFYTTYGSGIISEAGVDNATSKIHISIPYFDSRPANNTSAKVDGTVIDGAIPNIYEGYNIINVMRMNGEYNKGNKYSFYAIAQKKSDASTVKIVEFTTDNREGFKTLNITDYSTGNMTYRKGMEVISNARYDCAYYASGSKLYLWDVLNYKLPTTECLNLGAGKEITAVTLSYDMQQLYVAFYDSSSSNELKGGVYFYDASKLKGGVFIEPSQKYENITTRPVQILFKTEGPDMYNSN